jgi:hypothetical protein
MGYPYARPAFPSARNLGTSARHAVAAQPSRSSLPYTSLNAALVWSRCGLRNGDEWRVWRAPSSATRRSDEPTSFTNYTWSGRGWCGTPDPPRVGLDVDEYRGERSWNAGGFAA